MILRVTRGRVAPGREADFVEICRQTLADRARSAGLASLFPGYHRAGGTDRFLLAGVWASAEDADRSVGPPHDLLLRKVLEGVAEIDSFEIYDALQPAFDGIIDAPGGVIRMTSARVLPGHRAEFDAWLAANARSRQPQRLVLGWALGERHVDGREELIAISAWPSPLVVEALSETGSSERLLFAGAESYVSDVVIESYRAIGLNLPSELADVSARRVLAARFVDREPADAAARAVADAIASAADVPPSVAPLGAPGTATGVRSWILVVRLSSADHARAERLIADHGGEVILASRESATDEDGSSQPGVDTDRPDWSALPAN